MRWITSIFLFCSLAAWASDAAPVATEPDQVDKLLEALDAEDFEIRQHSEAELDAMGPELLPRLSKIVNKIESFEAQTRCRRLIRCRILF